MDTGGGGARKKYTGKCVHDIITAFWCPEVSNIDTCLLSLNLVNFSLAKLPTALETNLLVHHVFWVHGIPTEVPNSSSKVEMHLLKIWGHGQLFLSLSPPVQRPIWGGYSVPGVGPSLCHLRGALVSIGWNRHTVPLPVQLLARPHLRPKSITLH